VTRKPLIWLVPPRLLAAAALGAVLVTLSWSAADAQQLVALVNGEPITATDIAQRTRLTQISTHKAPPRQEVLTELVDEKLKLQIARRYKLEVTDTEVNTAFNNIAARARTSPQQFTQALAQAGVSAEALKNKLRADIAWQQIIRGKFQAQFQIAEKDVVAALDPNKRDDASGAFDYTLRPVLLIVPRGSPEAAFAARRREAEGLRNQFQNCEDGVRLARGLRDVAVRDPIVRSSADFAAAQREVLNSTPVGRLTPPEVTQQGIELFAVCGKKEASLVDSPTRREVRDKMLNERFQEQGRRYLRELRKSAMIEYR
jgi:peptidyl-prolyl cis-trans isomerase SurA